MRQASLDRTLRTLLAVLLAGTGLTCRDAGITGPPRIAPTTAQLLVTSVMATQVPDVPIAPYRKAHARLLTVPGESVARDTTITFADGDTTSAITLGVTVTALDERFLLALDLLDDQDRIVYSARDTVTAWVPGSAPQPPPTLITFVYAGQDTAAHRLAIAPRDTTLAVGAAVSFRAVALRADGSAIPGATVRFSSRGTGITVDPDGTVHATAAVANGGAMVVARLATGLSDSTTVTVTSPPVALVLAPDTVTLRTGRTLQLDARLRDAQGTQVTGPPITFASADPGVASVTAAGLVTAIAPGTSVVTARAGTLSATSTIRVTSPPVPSVRIAPRNATVLAGDTARFTATVLDTLGRVATIAPAWSLAVPSTAASIDPVSGLLTAAHSGSVIVVATAGGGADSVTVQLAAAARLQLAPSTTNLSGAGQRARFDATVLDSSGATIAGARLGWSLGDTSIASLDTIAAQAVVVLARRTGSTTIIASGGGLTASATLTIGGVLPPARISFSPTSVTLASLGELAGIAATVRDANGTVLADVPSWTSRDTTIVTVDANGTVLSRANGATWVVATAGPASDSLPVTVRQLVDTIFVARDTIRLALGDTTTIVPTLLDRNRYPIADIAASFSSDAAGVVSVTGGGLVTLVTSGSAHVTASAGGHAAVTVVMQGQGTGGVSASLAYIRITPGGGSPRMGGTLSLVAELVDASGVATGIAPSWASDQPGRAPVSSDGIVTLSDTGAVTITGTSQGIAGHAVFTVLPAPAVTSFSFAPATLRGASTSTLRFSVSVGAGDPGSGVGAVSVEFTGPGGVTRGCTSTTPTSGTTRRGFWDCAITLPAGSPTGSWHATRVTLAGTVPGTLDEKALSVLGPTVLTVLP